MDRVRQLTAVIQCEGDGYVATCQELDPVPVPDHDELKTDTENYVHQREEDDVRCSWICFAHQWNL